MTEIIKTVNTKFECSDGYLHPVTLLYMDDGRVRFQFPFDRVLMDEIKMLEGRKWLGPIPGKQDGGPKMWDAPLTARNNFRMAFMARETTGYDPYCVYEKPLPSLDFSRPVYEHQKEITSFILTRHYGIIAGQPGVGKTLSAIEAMERAGGKWWYICPKTAIPAIQREIRRWGARIDIELMTYEGLVSKMKNWTPGSPAPNGVIFDESSKLKTPTSQRSQAAKALADAIRNEYGWNGYAILMSGTPSPRSPSDWWWQCEIACPGFLKEASLFAFNARLGVTELKDNTTTGGVYNQLLCWRDDENKCNKCGILKQNHELETHPFEPSKNEVAFLYKRMDGLVVVKLKKDCLDLPDKRYDIIYCEPSKMMMQVAKTLVATAKNTITGLTLLRELSDGFQYKDVEDGFITCQECGGSGETTKYLNPETGGLASEQDVSDGRCEQQTGTCDRCKGKKIEPKYITIAEQVECPKEQALKDLLDEYEDIGRVVIYAGFTGSVDRCVTTCIGKGWCVIRVDGKGWRIYDGDGNPIQVKDPLTMFQDELAKYPRVAFVANADTASMALTLTASPVIIYYSNSFNGESRMQSEDRIHRPGMDLNRGARIIDLVHLPSDEGVLKNIKIKRDLQSMTLGELFNSEGVRE